MTDLYIDGAMLQRVRTNLNDIGDLLKGPGRAMARVDAAAMGASALEQRMNSFGDEWSYGIKKLSGFAKSAVEALDNIEKAFDDADKNLADELNKAGRKK